MDSAGQTATTMSSYALAIAKTLDHLGLDSGEILKTAGVTTTLSNDPLQRLPANSLTELFRVSVKATGDPYFGLLVARFISLSNLHAVGFGLASSHTLYDFCRRLARYFRMLSDSAIASVTEVGDLVYLRFNHVRELSGETEDAWLGFVLITMRELCDANFAPARVGFRHPARKPGSQPYETLFRAPVSFGASCSELVFAKASLELTLSGSNAELAQVNDGIATKYLALLNQNDVVSRVKQKVVELLPNGECRRGIVAKAMNMSPRSLQSKLAKLKTSFHDVMDDARREMAFSYVQQSAMTVTEIAFLLGFNDTSNFARAFKRWSGKSPTEFRVGA